MTRCCFSMQLVFVSKQPLTLSATQHFGCCYKELKYWKRSSASLIRLCMISLLAVFMLTGSRARGLRLRLMIVLQDGTKELLNTCLMSSYQTSIVVVIESCSYGFCQGVVIGYASKSAVLPCISSNAVNCDVKCLTLLSVVDVGRLQRRKLKTSCRQNTCQALCQNSRRVLLSARSRRFRRKRSCSWLWLCHRVNRRLKRFINSALCW